MYSNLFGTQIFIISRPKLGLIEHFGVLFDDNLVWHCTPERGTHCTTPEDFAQGFDVRTVREVPSQSHQLIWQRIRWIEANPHRYDIVNFNCIQFVNWLTVEHPPQNPKPPTFNNHPAQPVFR